jgi:hypothetical protein
MWANLDSGESGQDAQERHEPASWPPLAVDEGTEMLEIVVEQRILRSVLFKGRPPLLE